MFTIEGVKLATEHALQLLKERKPMSLRDFIWRMNCTDLPFTVTDKGHMGGAINAINEKWMDDWTVLMFKGKNPFELSEPIEVRMADVYKEKDIETALPKAMAEIAKITDQEDYDPDTSIAYRLTGELKLATKMNPKQMEDVLGRVQKLEDEIKSRVQ